MSATSPFSAVMSGWLCPCYILLPSHLPRLPTPSSALQVLLFVPEAGFFEPNYISSDLHVRSISRVVPIDIALASTDMVVLGTPGGGAELQIDGVGFSNDAAKMRVDLFWVSPSGSEQQAGCEVLTSSYSSLRCRTLSAPDTGLAVGQTVCLLQLNRRPLPDPRRPLPSPPAAASLTLYLLPPPRFPYVGGPECFNPVERHSRRAVRPT